MKKKTGLVYLCLAVVVSLFLTAGCAKKPAPAPSAATPGEAPVVTERPAGEEVQRFEEQPISEGRVDEDRAREAVVVPELQRIYFDFDQYTLTPEAKQVLADNAAFIRARAVNVLIEGHCDERGSDEYNLALGERRARAAQDYLVSLGIPANRLTVISYGEEQPLDRASSEAAWAKNRRAEFKVR